MNTMWGWQRNDAGMLEVNPERMSAQTLDLEMKKIERSFGTDSEVLSSAEDLRKDYRALNELHLVSPGDPAYPGIPDQQTKEVLLQEKTEAFRQAEGKFQEHFGIEAPTVSARRITQAKSVREVGPVEHDHLAELEREMGGLEVSKSPKMTEKSEAPEVSAEPKGVFSRVAELVQKFSEKGKQEIDKEGVIESTPSQQNVSALRQKFEEEKSSPEKPNDGKVNSKVEEKTDARESLPIEKGNTDKMRKIFEQLQEDKNLAVASRMVSDSMREAGEVKKDAAPAKSESQGIGSARR